MAFVAVCTPLILCPQNWIAGRKGIALRTRNSFWGGLAQSSDVTTELALETIRLAMRFAVVEHCPPSAKALDDQIDSAENVERLWNLLRDVIHAMALRRGAVYANEYAAQITKLFNGYVPKALELKDESLYDESKQAVRDIRLCWIVNRSGVIGCEQVASGPWFPGTAAFRAELQKCVDAGIAVDGAGSHWIQERKLDDPDCAGD